MKKIFIIALGFALAASLAACGCSRTDAPTTPSTNATTTPSTSPTTTILDPTIMDPTFETNIPDPNVDTSMPDPSVDTEMTNPSDATKGRSMH